MIGPTDLLHKGEGRVGFTQLTFFCRFLNFGSSESFWKCRLLRAIRVVRMSQVLESLQLLLPLGVMMRDATFMWHWDLNLSG